MFNHTNLTLNSDVNQDILRKTIEGYYNYFDYITFGNIISKQSKFVTDRTITIQFTKVQNEI